MVTLVPALTLTILSLLGNTCLGHKEALAETSEKATVRKCCPWGQTYDAWYNCVHLPGGGQENVFDLALFTTIKGIEASYQSCRLYTCVM